ncbi:MAG TPA: superoxide dismutase family protein [Tepidisphaeraceae bacterium]|jgi:Cu-Zn family superoxide dismutase
MTMTRNLAAALVLLATFAIGCQQEGQDQSSSSSSGSSSASGASDSSGKSEGKKGKVAVAHIKPAKAASTQPSFGQPMGTVTFTQMGDKVKVVADLTGLPPGKHGFHVHEKGDLSAADLTSTGGHFNPGGHPHGGPTTSPVHEGDLGNITADQNGTAHLDVTLDNISVGTGKPNDVMGRAVIVHAKPDDLSSQPSGNAGARIGGGKIENAAK